MPPLTFDCSLYKTHAVLLWSKIADVYVMKNMRFGLESFFIFGKFSGFC